MSDALKNLFAGIDLDSISDSTEDNEQAAQAFEKLAAFCRLQKVWVKLMRDKNFDAANHVGEELQALHNSLPEFTQW